MAGMKFKKLRKIYRILFPKKIKNSERFELGLQNNPLISDFEKSGTVYNLQMITGNTVVSRSESYSDYLVFQQIFNQQEYDVIIKLFELNAGFSHEKNIIDAGANVGYTTVYLSENLNNPCIFAIEPSEKNAELFEMNIARLANNSRITLYRKALSEREDMRYELGRDFRDGKDWSITTAENNHGTIEGISIAEIISENELSHVSLLKIDVEGAERFIFKQGNDFSFLKITEIIAIEIHDEYEIRHDIERILQQNNFFLFESGELTIGINKTLLNNL